MTSPIEPSAAPSRPTEAAHPLKKTANNVSDTSVMTTPLYEDHEPVVPVAATEEAAAPVATEEAVAPEEKHASAPSDLVLGDLVAEGGFCSIYELSGIKNLDNGEWILEPPRKSGTPKHRKRGSKNFTSLGNFAGINSSNKPPSNRRLANKRGQSSNALAANQDNDLPTLMKSVHVTVVTPFIGPEAAAMASASPGGSTPTKRSPFRRSQSRETAQEVLRRAPPYVLKCLKPAVFGTPKVLDMGLKDMQIEIDTLQKLNHPNIVSILAHGSMVLEGLSKFEQPYPFVILDRLGETLQDKLVYWEAKHQKHTSLIGKMVNRSYTKMNFCARERWQILRDLASALAYMHGQRYVGWLAKLIVSL